MAVSYETAPHPAAWLFKFARSLRGNSYAYEGVINAPDFTELVFSKRNVILCNAILIKCRQNALATECSARAIPERRAAARARARTASDSFLADRHAQLWPPSRRRFSYGDSIGGGGGTEKRSSEYSLPRQLSQLPLRARTAPSENE